MQGYFYYGSPDKKQKMRKQSHQQGLNEEVVFSLPGTGIVTKSYKKHHTTTMLVAPHYHQASNSIAPSS